MSRIGRAIFEQQEAEDAAEYLQAIENQANKGKHHVNSNNDPRRVGNREIKQSAEYESRSSSTYSSSKEAAPIPF